MDLGDRCGCDRFGEFEEELTDGAPERRLYRRPGCALRKGGHAVLEQRQVGGKFGADHVRARRQKLADLDIGRAEPFHRPGEAAAARTEPGLAAGKQAGELLDEACERGQVFGGDCRKRILARKDPADPYETEICSGSAHALRFSSRNAALRCRRYNW